MKLAVCLALGLFADVSVLLHGDQVSAGWSLRDLPNNQKTIAAVLLHRMNRSQRIAEPTVVLSSERRRFVENALNRLRDTQYFLLEVGLSAHARSVARDGRTFHKVPITELATTTFTHVEVCGLVTFVKREGDGDVHVRMDARGAFIVAELVSYRPLPVPKVKHWICVRGISRIDKAHGWPEINPAEAWWYARA